MLLTTRFHQYDDHDDDEDGDVDDAEYDDNDDDERWGWQQWEQCLVKHTDTAKRYTMVMTLMMLGKDLKKQIVYFRTPQ